MSANDMVTITLNDVTLREGDQAPMTSFSLHEKEIIALLLAEAGIQNIEVGFGSSRADSENIRAVQGLFVGVQNAPTLGSLGRATEGDTQASIEALGNGKSRIHIFMAMSDEHIEAKFAKQGNNLVERRHWAMNAAKTEIGAALVHKKIYREVEIEFSPEDATGNALTKKEDGKKYIDFESEQFAFLIQVIRMAIESGATVINVPDTLGNFLPHETEEFFRKISEKTADLREQYRFEFSAHIHNDAASATQNAIAAIRGGATQIEVTIGGIGERTGNTSLHEIIGLIEETGQRIIPGKTVTFAHPIRTKLIGPLTRLVDGILQDDPTLRRPFIGTLSDTDGSGVHNATQSVYGKMKPKAKYGGLDMEEFFSPRGGATQVKNILQGFGVNINKMDGIIQKVTAKACQEAESVRAIFPARVYAIYLQESQKLSITNIHIQDKTTSVEFTLNGVNYTLSGIGDGENGAIDGFVNALKNNFPGLLIDILDMNVSNKPSLSDLMTTFQQELVSNQEVLSVFTQSAIQSIIGDTSTHESSEQDAIVKMRCMINGKERNIWTVGKDTEKATIEAILYAVLPTIIISPNRSIPA